MKKTNRILSMLLAVIMVACMLPVSVFAADEATYTVSVQYYGSNDGGTEPTQNTGGSVAGADEYAPGASVTITATPDAENGFCTTQWTDVTDPEKPVIMNGYGTHDNETEYTFTMPENDVAISITFVKHNYIGYAPNEDGQSHDVHCVYCKTVYEANEAHVDETGAGNDPSNGYCDKCSVRLPGIYIVRFDGNHDSAEGRVYDHIVNVDEATIALPVSGFTLEGHTFQGWSTERTATYASYRPGDTYTVEEDTTFYAIWNDNDHVHNHPTTWSSDKDEHWHECECGDMADKSSHEPGPAATATTPQTCTVCGYEMAPATGYTLTLDYAITSFSGVTVGTGSKAVTGIGSGEVVDLSQHWPDELIVTGSDGETYYFADFVKNSDGSGDILNSVTMDSDKTLYACWSIEKHITVLLDPNGGFLPYRSTRVSELSYADIFYMNSVHKPVRSGYSFVGWSLEQDEMADDDNTVITDNCTLYAVWQSGSDEPPATDVPVKIGGDYDAILRDGMVIVQGEDPISGTLDLGETDAEAIQFSYASVEKSAIERTEATILFPGGPSATLTGPAWAAAKDALKVGENLQISVDNVGAEVLPDSLTKKEPFEDEEVLFYSGTLIDGAAVFTKQELLDLGVISNDDDDITWEDLKYLYHYMTTADLRSLGWFIEDFLADYVDPQIQVWIAEMIERDTVTPLTLDDLTVAASLTVEQWEGLSDMGVKNPSIGQIRQLGLTQEQMGWLQNEVKTLRQGEHSADIKDKYDALLDWLDDAIGQKEPENEDTPKYVQVTGTPDGKNPYFVAAVDVNMIAVRADGTTAPVAIKAEKSDAFEWSTTVNVSKLLMDAVDWDVNNIRAYKVHDDGSWVEKGIRVTRNEDGTYSFTAVSDGNSTYVFLYEPAKADVDDTPTTPEVPDSPQTGDNSHIWLWIVVSIVSLIALVGTCLFGRIKKAC